MENTTVLECEILRWPMNQSIVIEKKITSVFRPHKATTSSTLRNRYRRAVFAFLSDQQERRARWQTCSIVFVGLHISHRQARKRSSSLHSQKQTTT